MTNSLASPSPSEIVAAGPASAPAVAMTSERDGGGAVGWLRGAADAVTAVANAVYDVILTRPLRRLYFVGPVWHNIPAEEICFTVTHVPAKHWTSSPENMAACQHELDKLFDSWDTTVVTSLYFALLAFLVIKIAFCCNGRGGGSACAAPCHCRDSWNEGGGGRPVTVDELRDLLREARAKKVETDA